MWLFLLMPGLVMLLAAGPALSDDLHDAALVASRGHHQATTDGVRLMVMIEPRPVVAGRSYRVQLTFADAKTGFPLRPVTVRAMARHPDGTRRTFDLSFGKKRVGDVEAVETIWRIDAPGRWVVDVEAELRERGVRTWSIRVPVGEKGR